MAKFFPSVPLPVLVPALAIAPPRRGSRYAALGLLVLLLSACGGGNKTAEKIAKDTRQIEDFDNSLTFNAVTLEEFDDKGRLWWKVKAKQASYSKDKKVARIQEPDGEFFQDGKSIIKVLAKSGEVKQNGQTILLQGEITAIDTREGLTLKGNELEWEPRKDKLVVRDKLTGTHREMKVAAQSATYLSRSRQLELKGEVTAMSTQPQVQFKGDRLLWLIQKKQVQSFASAQQPVQIVRYKDKQPTDQAQSNQLNFDLKTNVATLTKNAQVSFTKPAMVINSQAIVWNLERQTVASDQPLTVVNRDQQLTLTGNSGTMDLTANTANLLGGVTIVSQRQQLNLAADAGRWDLQSNMAYLTGNVRGASTRNASNIATDRLDLNLGTQDFLADGNVVYRQANPVLNLAGPRARGRMQDQASIVVDGGSTGGRVVTEFVPEP
jgi:LPS export ABC transporter protein LptC